MITPFNDAGHDSHILPGEGRVGDIDTFGCFPHGRRSGFRLAGRVLAGRRHSL